MGGHAAGVSVGGKSVVDDPVDGKSVFEASVDVISSFVEDAKVEQFSI